MTHIYSGIVIFVLCISSVYGQETCPTGKPRAQDCNLNDCPLDSKCFRKDNERLCCGELGAFCPTKMHAFNSIDDRNSYSWGPVDKAEKAKWYNVELGGETIACPVPMSFAYRTYNKLNVLPVDFNASNPSSNPKACRMNSNCKKDNDEFCGAATNPSFTPELDRSGENGDSLRFCYKFQNFGSTNVKPIIKADNKELIRCTNHSDCSPAHGSETFCFIKEAKKEDGTITKDGFCAFEELTTTSIYWYSLFASVGCTIVFLVISVVCYFAKQGSSSSPTEEESSTTNKLSKKDKKKKKRSKKKSLSKSRTLSKIAEPPTRPNLNADGKPKFEFDPKVRFDFENEAFGNLPADDQIRFLTTPAIYESFGNLFREKLFRAHKEVLRKRGIYPPHLARDFHFRNRNPASN